MSKANPKFAELKDQIVTIFREKGAMTAAQLADFVPQNWSVMQIGCACRVLAKAGKIHASAYAHQMIIWKEGSAPLDVTLNRNYRHLNHQQIVNLLELHGPMTASQISQVAHVQVASIAMTCSHLQARGDICGQQVPIGHSVRMMTIYSLPDQKLPHYRIPSTPGMVSMKATLNEHREWMKNLNNERRYKAQRHAMRGRA